jgi:hypothetical protein
MFWIAETFEALADCASLVLLVDGKPAPLVALEEVNAFTRVLLHEPAPGLAATGRRP